MMVKPDSDHGIRGTTTKSQFIRGFKKLVTDVALKKQTSRTLNTKEDIKAYFDSFDPSERPEKKQGSFVPADIIEGKSVASATPEPPKKPSPKKSKSIHKGVLPRTLKIRVNNLRLIDIRRELTKLNREEFPNAGAVLLRVFFELAAKDFLERTGQIEEIKKRFTSKGEKLPSNFPTLQLLVPVLMKIADKQLSKTDASGVKMAIQYNSSAPFTISELHRFVHHYDLPSARDILKFWERTEPLFRLMLEQDAENVTK